MPIHVFQLLFDGPVQVPTTGWEPTGCDIARSAPGDNTPYGNGPILSSILVAEVVSNNRVMTPGHYANDLQCHGTVEPDVQGCRSLTEEKFSKFKSNHVAAGSHPHFNDAADTVSITCFSVCGEPETIIANQIPSLQ